MFHGRCRVRIRVQCAGFGGEGFRVSDLGFRVWGLGTRSRLRVLLRVMGKPSISVLRRFEGLGSRVQGSGFRLEGHTCGREGVACIPGCVPPFPCRMGSYLRLIDFFITQLYAGEKQERRRRSRQVPPACNTATTAGA